MFLQLFRRLCVVVVALTVGATLALTSPAQAAGNPSWYPSGENSCAKVTATVEERGERAYLSYVVTPKVSRVVAYEVKIGISSHTVKRTGRTGSFDATASGRYLVRIEGFVTRVGVNPAWCRLPSIRQNAPEF